MSFHEGSKWQEQLEDNQRNKDKDSLLRGIRNKKDANLFMAELDTAIKVSQSNNNLPKLGNVAIVMPVYNAEKFLEKTIQCFLDQTYSGWELFAVDDGSTDKSLEILKKFTDPRIRVISEDTITINSDDNGVIVASEKNVGPAIARNKALQLIKNNRQFKYVAYCDSDDRWKPNHLLIAMSNFTDLSYDMIYTDCDFSLENGTQVTTFGIPYYDKFDIENLKKQNFIYISTVVHRIECLSVGDFDKICVPMEDYDMWFRIAKEYKVNHVQTVTATYMFKDGGSYYSNEDSKKAYTKVHLKNSIFNDDNLSEQLESVKDLKMEFIRKQKYEEAAKLRDVEKHLIDKINVFNPQSIEGWLSDAEGKALTQYSIGKDCLEIGSYKGKSANYIAPKAKSLVCIDPFRADSSGQSQYVDYTTLQEFLKNTSRFKNITPVIGKSEDVFDQFKDEQFDMIFIDGMHDYESVKKDIDNYWPKLKMGGHMCFHDYQKDWIGVIQAFDEYFIRPDTLFDSVAVIQKVFSELIKYPGESLTLKEILENKFLLMKNLNISLEDVAKMNFYDFNNYVKTIKSKISEDEPHWNGSSDFLAEDLTKDLTVNSGEIRKIKKVIVIAPWSNKLPDNKPNPKNFPINTMIELVDMLKKDGYFTIQIGVSGEELIGTDEIVLNASFERLKEILDKANTFISVDSFFPHFAHFHGKQGFVLFSQSDPKLFGYPENVNIYKSKEHFRKQQYWLWVQAEYDKAAYLNAKEIFDVLKVNNL